MRGGWDKGRIARLAARSDWHVYADLVMQNTCIDGTRTANGKGPKEEGKQEKKIRRDRDSRTGSPSYVSMIDGEG